MTLVSPRATRALLIALVAAAAIVSGALAAPGDLSPLAAASSPSGTVSSYRAQGVGRRTSPRLLGAPRHPHPRQPSRA